MKGCLLYGKEWEPQWLVCFYFKIGGLTFTGIVPYVTCSITTYELLKKNTHSRIEELNGGQIEKGSLLDHSLKLSYGTISSFLGKTLSYPADTVRRRRQLMGTMPSVIDSAVISHSDIHDRSLPKPNLIKLEADEFSSGITRYGSTSIKTEGSASTSALEPLFTQKGQPMYKNTMHAFKRIIQEEGMGKFFKITNININLISCPIQRMAIECPKGVSRSCHSFCSL